MGDSRNDPLRVDFDHKIKLEFHGSTVTSDAGLLAYRELDDALELTCTAATGLHDTRTGPNTQHGREALHPSVHLQPTRRVRGRERRSAAVRRSHDADRGRWTCQEPHRCVYQ